MLVSCRGRIPAIILCTCAAMMTAKASAESTSVSQTVATVGDDLLRSAQDSNTLDVRWMLQDDRQILLNGAFPADHAPLPKALMQKSTLQTPRPRGLPHVDAPDAGDDPANLNDRLVPVPVVSVGWAIVLCAVLFNIGARVLKFRRVAAR